MNCWKCQNNINVNSYRRLIGLRRVFYPVYDGPHLVASRESIEPFYGPEVDLCYVHLVAAMRRDKAQRAPLKVFK